MIEVVERNRANEAPASSLEELFDRLVRVVGRTLVVKIEVRRNQGGYGHIQTGVLRWADQGSTKRKGLLRIDMGKQISEETPHYTCIDPYSAVWALIDGELIPVHVPEGEDRSYSSKS